MSGTTLSEDGEIDTFTVPTPGTFALYFCRGSNGSESVP